MVNILSLATVTVALCVKLGGAAPILTSLSNSSLYDPMYREAVSMEGTNGICTYYNYGGTGACGTPITEGVAICAMSPADDWKSHCGKTIEFSNDKGSGTCEVRDECPECKQGHLDMTLAAFLNVCTIKEGICSIAWNFKGSNQKNLANISTPVPSDGLLKVSATSGDVSVTFEDTSFKNVFGEQWSWNEPSEELKHFNVGSCGQRTALRVSIFSGDETFSKGSPTFPRSELDYLDKTFFKVDQAYTVTWEGSVQQYQSDYMFAFAQIFDGGDNSEGPNIFLRWEQGKYLLWCVECGSGNHVELEGNMVDDVGKWIQWSLQFKLSKSKDGYIKAYRDGKLLNTLSGQTTTSGEGHHLKLGIYTQHVDAVKDTSLCLSNLVIQQN